MPTASEIVGTELRAGTFTIDPDEDATLVRALESEPLEGDAAHPVWAYIATQRGIGVSVAELCAIADFDVADGPLLGSSTLTYGEPLRVGVEYRVVGEVIGFDSKEGRSGRFDLFTYRERLLDSAGGEVAAATNVFVLPRKGE